MAKGPADPATQRSSTMKRTFYPPTPRPRGKCLSTAPSPSTRVDAGPTLVQADRWWEPAEYLAPPTLGDYTPGYTFQACGGGRRVIRRPVHQ